MKAYNVRHEDMVALYGWAGARPRPPLFLSVPSVKDVGEAELVRELADAAYEADGFQDAPSRHFVSRNFPCGAGAADYARFADDPVDAAEISNHFHGVDCIDASAWLGREPAGADWERLPALVRSSPHSDFVFLAYSDSRAEAGRLADAISASCGMALRRVAVGYPHPKALAEAFCRAAPLAVAGAGEAEEWVRALLDAGAALNYPYVESLAAIANCECACGGALRASSGRVLERCARHVPARARRLGF